MRKVYKPIENPINGESSIQMKPYIDFHKAQLDIICSFRFDQVYDEEIINVYFDKLKEVQISILPQNYFNKYVVIWLQMDNFNDLFLICKKYIVIVREIMEMEISTIRSSLGDYSRAEYDPENILGLLSKWRTKSKLIKKRMKKFGKSISQRPNAKISKLVLRLYFELFVSMLRANHSDGYRQSLDDLKSYMKIILKYI